jgi:hypothetical protein
LMPKSFRIDRNVKSAMENRPPDKPVRRLSPCEHNA